MTGTSRTTGRVLVVDEPGNRAAWGSILRGESLELSGCEDGCAALDLLRHEGVDVVVTDARLPDMSGVELGRRVRQLHPDVETVLTARGSDFVAGERAGFDVLRKPLERATARRSVRQACELHRLRVENERLQGILAERREDERGLRELLRANAELEEHVADLDAFARTAAHALKTPLLTLSGLTGALRAAVPARREELESRICRVVDRLTGCVDDLLLLARAEHGEVEAKPLDMETIVADAARRVEELRVRVGGQIETPPRWPQALGHAPWIEEVWVNLLSNGLKYGGPSPVLTLGADASAERARFWVDDRGPGLTQAAQALLFRPFSRLGNGPTEGFGLGLSIVARIAERLGGHAFVESTPGEGSRFGFVLRV